MKREDIERIEIEIPDGKRAEWVNGVLTLVDDKPKDITERIKTFEDAYKELGKKNVLVKEYDAMQKADSFLYAGFSADVMAYMKLRIIVAALNEGWEPRFTENEERYYSWCRLYTQEEIDEMGEQRAKERNMVATSQYKTGYAGLAGATSNHAPSRTHAHCGSRLCLKSDALAVYCGKQFTDIWADFLLIRK